MNIVITGASRGIGFDTALAFSKDPNNKIYALSRTLIGLEKLEQKAAQLYGHNNLRIHTFDITHFSKEDIEALNFDGGKVDILINNAGLLINKSFRDMSMKEWRQIFEVNFFGVIRLIQLLEPYLKHSSIAHIVNIGSMGGVQGSVKFSGLAAYSASKAAIMNLTECLAAEYADTHIKVNCLALGAVQTEMLNEAFPGYQAPVTAADMAEFVAHFSANLHPFFNGKLLPVALNNP